MNFDFTTLRRAFNSINPFYRNPIQGMPDYAHLDARVSLLNPHLDRSIICDVLKGNDDVLDAIAELEGDYYLEAALVDCDLRVNVFEIHHRWSEDATARIFNPLWKEQGIAQFFLNVEGKHASVRLLDGPVMSAFYEPHAPRHSWTIPLDGSTRVRLGLKVSG